MNGNDLVDKGNTAGPHFRKILSILNQRQHTDSEIAGLMAEYGPKPVMDLQDAAPCIYNITADNENERANIEAVRRTMDVVLRTPVVSEAAIMPDACPAGPVGVFPVGGVVATENAIVPGMHSAGICCSLMSPLLDGNLTTSDAHSQAALAQ